MGQSGSVIFFRSDTLGRATLGDSTTFSMSEALLNTIVVVEWDTPTPDREGVKEFDISVGLIFAYRQEVIMDEMTARRRRLHLASWRDGEKSQISRVLRAHHRKTRMKVKKTWTKATWAATTLQAWTRMMTAMHTRILTTCNNLCSVA